MLEEFDEYIRKIWEEKKTPLEKMYDKWMGEGNWEPRRPRSQFALYSLEDIIWRGIKVVAGERFPCHLCGATDHWTAEVDDAHHRVRVFVCEHEPIDIGRGAIRQISSVSPGLISRVEETYHFAG
jgi:hypothetical protein